MANLFDTYKQQQPATGKANLFDTYQKQSPKIEPEVTQVPEVSDATPSTVSTEEWIMQRPDALSAARGLGYTGSDRHVVQSLIEDRRWADTNTVAAFNDLHSAMTGNPEEIKNLAKVREVWANAPGILDQVMAGEYGMATENLWSNVWRGTLDPVNLVSLGVGKMVGTKLAAVGAGMAVDATATGVLDVAHQTTDIISGNQEEFDIGRTALSTAIGAAASVPGSYLAARSGVKKNPQAMFKARQKLAESVAEGPLKETDPTSIIIKFKDSVNQRLFDSYAGIRRAQKIAGEHSSTLDDVARYTSFKDGDLVTDLLPADEFQLLSNTRSVAELALTDKPFRISKNGDFVSMSDGKSLLDVFKGLKDTPDGPKLLMDFVAAKRANHLRGRGIEVGLTKKEADAIIANTPEEVTQHMSSLKEFTDWLLDFRVDMGLMTRADKARILKENPVWMPFYKTIDDGPRPTGSNALWGDLRTIKGIDDAELSVDFDDWLTSIARYTETTVSQGMRNRAQKSLGNFLQKHGGKGTAIRDHVAEPLRFVKNKWKTLDGKPIDIRSNGKGGSPTVLRWKEAGGARRAMLIKDQHLAESLNSMNPEAAGLFTNWFMSGAGRVKRFTSDVITHNPAFAWGTAFIRDAQNVWFTSNTMHTPLMDHMNGAFEAVWKTKDYQDFLLNGGGFSSITHTEGREALEEIYKRAGQNIADIASDKTSFTKIMGKWYKNYEKWVVIPAEHASRTAEYIHMNRLTGNKRLAALAGREVSVDFGGHGSSKAVRAATTVAPFLNAALRSIHKLGRVVGNKKTFVNRVLPVGGAIAASTLATYDLNKEYPIYQQAPDWLKDTHILIPYNKQSGEMYPEDPNSADGRYAIPLGYDLGMAFNMMPRRIMEAGDRGTSQGAAAMKGVYHFFKNTFSFAGQGFVEGLPVVGPALRILENETHTGSKIVTDSEEALRATGRGHEAFRSDTPQVYLEAAEAMNSGMSEFLKGTNRTMGSDISPHATNVTPEQIRHWVEGTFMWMAKLGIDMAEESFHLREQAGRGENPYGYAKEMFKFGVGDHDNLHPSQMPYTRIFYRNKPYKSGYMDEKAREYKTRVQDASKAVQEMKKALYHNPGIVDELFSMQDKAKLMAGPVRDFQERMTQYKQEEKRVGNHPKMTAEDKRNRLIQLNNGRHRVVEQFVQDYMRRVGKYE